jgi:hypothetical protein
MRAATLRFVVIACLFGLTPAWAETFNFEDLAVGTEVNAQYGSRGVLFRGAYLDSDPHAHSGSHVLRSIPPTAEVFSIIPLVMDFPSPQAHVAFFAGNFPGGGSGTLRVFNSAGQVIGQDGPKPVDSNSFNTFFEVRLTSTTIVRAEYQVEGAALESIDDLVVDGGTIVVVNTPPKVTITNPTEGAVVPPGGTVNIQGTVVGDSLLPNMTLRVVIGLPNDSTAPPSNNVVTLSGTGTQRTFSLNYGVIAGIYTVTAIGTNTSNLQGTATVHFSSLPDAIQTRYQSSGGAAVFGNLRFGTSETGCIVAVYDKGLIAAVGNQTFIAQGAIFQKWLATREVGSTMSKLGCPTAEQRDAIAGAKAQDFKHGRIYVTANTAAYVPAVFRDAIETLGGEGTTGIATSDPTSSSGAMQTWLFQRFPRLDHPSVEPSTLEIRGTPPVLYVERVGDGLEDLDKGGLTLFWTTATIYRTFPCTGQLGPCTVKKPGWSPTIMDGSRYCDGRYPVTTLTEWHRMNTTEYEANNIGGWVKSSQLACLDNPLTHDFPTTNGSGRCSVTDVFPSDWQVYVQPMNPYGDILTFDQSTLEVEFEAYYAQYFFVGWGWPLRGDLIFVNGRWIMDCGHSPYKTEIHPPFLMSNMRTQKRKDGTLETIADMWITGYYPGDPVDVDLWPPPRPTPDAFLTLTKPLDSDAALGLNVAVSTSFTGGRARFTASRREVDVDHSGKMNWEAGRGYEGEWEVYWSLR